MTGKTNNQILLESKIEDYKSENSIRTDENAFDIFVLTQITKNLEIAVEEIVDSIIDGGNDGGVDAVLFFCNGVYFDSLESLKTKGRELNVEVKIIQSKNTIGVSEDVMTRLQSSLIDVFELSKDLKNGCYSPSFVAKAELLRSAWRYVSNKNQNLSVNIYYISKSEFSNLSHGFENKKTQVEKILQDNQISGNFLLYGAKELLDLSRKKEDYTASLNFDQITNSKRGEGYIGFVNLNEFYKCITDDDNKIREHIFEDNVRDHLRGREVNQEIMKTLMSDAKKDFWCLNNGVTILSSEVTPSGNILNIKNIQIVNGLQTSYQIYQAKKDGAIFDKDNYLIVKVVITNEENLKTDIIRSTNRQTPVEVAGFRALDKIQIDIEEFFKKNGLYYDRRKNYFKNKGITASKIVSIQLLAQCIFSIIYKDPSTARSKPVSLLKKGDNYQKAFLNIEKNLWLFLFCITLFKKVDKLLRDLKNKYKKDEKKEIQRIVSSNYKFHICRILMSVLLKKQDFTLKEVLLNKKYLCAKNKTSLNKELGIAFNKLVEIITIYLKRNKKTVYDLISISKNPSFDKEITTYL